MGFREFSYFPDSFSFFLFFYIISLVILINKYYQNMDQTHYEIPWSYGDKVIKISSFSGVNSPDIIINIHGTFWSMYGGNNKYLEFAKNIQSNQVANVILYESSRKNIEPNPNETDIYKQKQAKFIGKTFTDELEDARRVLQDVISKSYQLFWIKKENLKITLNGNSLWWILAFYLASEFPQVQAIVSVGTGLRLEIKDVPILDTFPKIEFLRQKLESFQGKYVCYYGTLDDIFNRESFFNLVALVGSDESKKSMVEMPWVDHSFWKISWQISDIPYQEVFLWHKLLLKK